LSEFDAVNIEDGTKLTLPEDILFDFDSSELLPEANEAIDQLVKVIETTDDEEEIAIVGHTDGKGEEKYNQKLSEKRAQSVCPTIAISSSDRKSTRLNSSHVSISYAVFCLKK